MKKITRRDFLTGSAAGAVAMALGMFPGIAYAEETAEGDVIASGEKYTATVTADGWVKVVNDGGPTLGYSLDSGVSLIEVDGYAFKDLNGNGELDVYEDWRESAEDRAADLASKITDTSFLMNLMVHESSLSMELDASDCYSYNSLSMVNEVIPTGRRYLLSLAASQYAGSEVATLNNSLQAACEKADYGIPFSLSTNPGAVGDYAGNLGLAASADPDFVFDVHEAMAKQYRAIGITTLLGPQVDLATEPRWRRISGTFGEDPALSAALTDAAVSGLQSTYDADGNDLGWGEDSIITMTKHFPGDGAGESGRESHSDSGKFTVYPGDGFETALIPFVDGALDLTYSSTGVTSGIMTSYSIAYSDDEEYGELVGSAFSDYKISILRDTYGWDGVICSDWGVTSGSTAWGVEDLSNGERIALAIEAGVDMIGGDQNPDLDSAKESLLEYYGSEEALLERLQESARRIVLPEFEAGLFENAYTDATTADTVVATEEYVALEEESQLRSVVMVKNADNTIAESDGTTKTVYIPYIYSGSTWTTPVDLDVAAQYFTVVTDTLGDPTGEADENGNATYTEEDLTRASDEELATCDYAIAMISSPSSSGYDSDTETYIPISLQYGEYVADGENVRTESISGSITQTITSTPYGDTIVEEKEDRSYYGQTAVVSNAGDLDYVLETAERIPDSCKLVVCLDCDNPTIVSEFEAEADAILVGFGTSDFAYDEIIAGTYEPSGLLPFQMPADMDTVEAQLEDIPRDMECYVDSAGNTYDFAFGMNWSGVIADDRVATYSAEAQTVPENQGTVAE